MSYILEHTVLGFCWWDVPALILLIMVIVVFAWKNYNMKKQKRELEDQISEMNEEMTGSLNGGRA